PLHPRPRRQVLLQHVGVELDEAGQEQIPLEVEPTRYRTRVGRDLCDGAICRAQSSLEAGLAGDDQSIGDDELVPHVASASLRLTTRVATHSRTSLSWKVPRSAVPRWRASWTSCTTRARLAASNQPAGSSCSARGGPPPIPPGALTPRCLPPREVRARRPARRA